MGLWEREMDEMETICTICANKPCTCPPWWEKRISELDAECERLQTERDEAEERLADYFTKDAGKTNEINILTKENRRLRKALEKIIDYLEDGFGGCIDAAIEIAQQALKGRKNESNPP